MVLPVPAGPTINTSRSWPATAAAASRCIHIETLDGDCCRWLWVCGLGVDRPGEDPFFLGEDLVGGDVRGDRFDPHRPAIGTPNPCRVTVRWVEVDALRDHLVCRLLHARLPIADR